MKILYIDPSYYPAFKYGGTISCVHLLHKALIKKGIDVDVLTTNAGQDDKNLLLNTWQIVDGVRVKYCQHYGYEHYTFSFRLFWESIRLAKKYDLIVTDSIWNFSALAASIAGLICGRPYIIIPHGVLYKETLEMKSKFKKMLYWNLIAKHCVAAAAAIQFTTQDEREKVIEYLKIKTYSFVAPNGVKHSDFDALPGPDALAAKYPGLRGKPYLLFLGRITPKKGLDLLVAAFDLISAEFPDLQLVIVGPDNEDYAKQVIAALKERNLLERTTFTGMLLKEDRLSAFAGANIFVLPSYSENFGMAVVEAMACGIPVVISDKVGIYREVIQNDAGIVVQTTPESVAEGIRRLLNVPALKSCISKNGQKMAREIYDVDKVADLSIAKYKEVVLSVI